MDLNRLINRLNYRSPSGECHNTGEWISNWIDPHRRIISKPWSRLISSGEKISINFKEITGVTNEDYLLKIDIEKNRDTESRDRILYSIPKGRVLGPEGYTITPDNILLKDLSYTHNQNEKYSVFRRRRFPRLTKLNGSFVSLVYPDSDNYYHWLLESLPIINAISSLIPSIDGVIVPKLKPFHRDSLARFGFLPNQLIELTSHDYLECEQLLAQSFNSSWTLHSWVPRWLKENMLTRSATHTDKKLYISRADSSWRKVSNEDEVIKFLSSAGYEIVILSSLSSTEQANLFNSATSIISVHGAGLANLAYCSSGTRVLEIFPPRWTSLCYLRLAVAVECVYHYMIASPLGQPKEQVLNDSMRITADSVQQGSDLNIPLDKLSCFLDQEIAGQMTGKEV